MPSRLLERASARSSPSQDGTDEEVIRTMIIDYDKSSVTKPEDQIKSLRDNVQLAMNEQQELLDKLSGSFMSALGVDVDGLSKALESLVAQIDDIERRVTELENA